MGRETTVKETTLAKAAILFCQKALAAFPGAVIELIDQHYSDEDLTLEVQVQAGIDVRQASDDLLRIALDVEDQYGVTIITSAVRRKEMGG
jgi:uncharacterized alkaline shock family protein YloU